MQQHELDAAVGVILGLMANWDAASNTEKRERWDQILNLHRTISRAYGTRRGWVRAGDQFSIEALTDMKAPEDGREEEFTDHRSFWTVAGRPAAIVAHLYGCDEVKREAARIWAASLGLQVTFPTDFPSWWNPGRTTLIEITRAA